MPPSEETRTSDDGVKSTTSDSSHSDTPTTTDGGQDKLQTAKQKINEFCEKLETYLDDQAVPRPKKRRINEHLDMTRHQLGLMSAEDLAEVAYEIHTYTYYLQDVINRQLAKADMCRHEIEKSVGSALPNYKDYYGKEEKWIAAINDNEHAWKLREIEKHARAVVTRLAFMSMRLDNIARAVQDIYNTKRR